MNRKMPITLLFVSLFLLSSSYSFSDSVISLPYKKIGNLIIVQAEVEGQQGNFILDTGEPGLCLNGRHFKDHTDMPFEASTTGINGHQQTVFFYQTRLKLAGLKQAHNAQVRNLSHLEKQKGLSILGLIGRAVFKKHELLLDLVHETILLIPIDRRGNRISREFSFPLHEILFAQAEHFPVVSAQVAGRELRLGLDTGAEFNVIDRKFQSDLMEFARLQNGATLVNGSRSRKVRSARISGFQVEGLECWPMMTLFASMKSLNGSLRGEDLDGLLGVEFLVQNRISINFKKNTLYIWDRYTDDREILAAKNEDQN
jgi:hypothetical protein